MVIDIDQLAPELAYTFTRIQDGEFRLRIVVKTVSPVSVLYPETWISSQRHLDDALAYVAGQVKTTPGGA